jgi:DNA polymerase I-like protein with 3'-5' exonuclease and polymerase domains
VPVIGKRPKVLAPPAGQTLKKYKCNLIALDTETTGVDHWHGAKPFLVTACLDSVDNLHWEWDVDPLTREPIVVQEHVDEIQGLIDSSEWIVGQNLGFDYLALKSIGIHLDLARTYDTLCAGHILGSNLKHDLYSMLVQYCDEDLSHLEDRLEVAVVEARQMAKRDYSGKVLQLRRHNPIMQPCWRIAEKGLPEMPSAKGEDKKKRARGVESDKPWKFDCWLPRAIATARKYTRPRADCEHQYPDWQRHGCDWKCRRCGGHWWWTICSEYANGDSAGTMLLWPEMRRELERRSLWKIFLHELKLSPITCGMRDRGVTMSRSGLMEREQQYKEESTAARNECVEIAAGFGAELTLPKSGANDSLRQFIFGTKKVVKKTQGAKMVSWEDCPGLRLEPVSYGEKSAEPSVDKDSLEIWENVLEHGSPGQRFFQELRGIRSRDTAVSYLAGYVRYWLPVDPVGGDFAFIDGHPPEWWVLHAGMRPWGTDHLRFASSDPNVQNISKKKNFNLRSAFRPAPGREWWSLDASNIELRIPVFEANETEAMQVFLEPERPPYYGSYHLLTFDTLWPDIFREHGKAVKTLFEDTNYQWTKNGTYARQYGAQRKKVNITYHHPDAWDLLATRFPRVDALNAKYQANAKRFGYVTTIPDRTVDPDRGYPILVGRTQSGDVMPTTSFCYHISGTACQWMRKAMVRCEPQLEEWRRRGFDAFITLQVHDELVFDMPKRANPLKNPKASNLGRIRVLQRLMEQGGDDIGVPIPVAVEYNEISWDEGVAIAA